ncbi:fibronectin type III domain-containing protein [Streptomyces sp. NPDC059411]|uniref:fibronectin type III domain-containing protein n=1 Tax=Streptomyces sp. NPDC059411 TaxID=3346825 RepID=UPI0036A04AB6
MTRATIGDRVLKDDTVVADAPDLTAPTWYTATDDGSPSIVPPHRRTLRGEPIAGGSVGYNEIALAWRQLAGGISKAPVPGGMGSAPVESLARIGGYNVYIGALPVPASGAVPVPVPPTVPSLVLTHPTESTVISGFWIPGTPPALPTWQRIMPSTMYAIVIEPLALDMTPSGKKSATLYVETGSVLPQITNAPLAAPTSLSFQRGTVAPNPASGAPGPFFLEFAAVSGAASYEVYATRNPRPGMAPTPGLMEGDVLVGSGPAPAMVDSQRPVHVTTGPISTPGYIALKVRAVAPPDALGGVAHSPFSGPLTTVLLATSRPAPPANLRLNGPATATSVPVQWDALGTATPPVAEYRLYESAVHRLTVPASATSATVPGYAANDLYNITIRGVSTEGIGAPSVVLTGRTAP